MVVVGQYISNQLTQTLPNFAMLPADWQRHWLRLLVGTALAVSIAALLGRAFHRRRHRAVERLKERERAKDFLVREHTRRLTAERETRSLSQRLITAHEDERKHLARELHDDVTQRLARLAIDAAQAERGVPSAPDRNSWRRMREQLVRLSGDVHSLAYRLHPSILNELGLVETLRAECDRFSRQESIPVTVRMPDHPGEIRGETALCLFRVCQESLRNAARHAHAEAVDVFLARMDGGLQLAVHDDGIGFNPAKARENASLGLTSMKERVHLVQGELDVESAPGHGTTIVAWVPLKEASKS